MEKTDSKIERDDKNGIGIVHLYFRDPSIIKHENKIVEFMVDQQESTREVGIDQNINIKIRLNTLRTVVVSTI